MSYYTDHRVRAKDRKRLSMIGDRGVFRAVDEDGNDIELNVPVAFEVCPTCQGKGKHVNPSIDCDGLSREDFDEDPDFRELYFSGAYDVACYECDGMRVVPVIVRDKLDAKTLELIDDSEQGDREYAAELAHQRRYNY